MHFANFCRSPSRLLSDLTNGLAPKVLDDPKCTSLYRELAKMRRLAFVGVSVSAIAMLIAAFLVPFLHNQIQYVQSMAQDELTFCRMRSNNIWKEIGRAELANHQLGTSKNKRQLPAEEAKCCGCGIGAPGMPGLPGNDGKDGRDGQPGMTGLDSEVPFDFPMPSLLQPQQWCFVCEEAVAGPVGPAGKKGTRGRDGIPGSPGADGIMGRQGMIGIQGPPGTPGLPGSQGKPGGPGELFDLPGTQGQPGMPGPPGLPGAAGLSGEPGRPGEDGQPGEVGDPGMAGKNGSDGEPGARGTDGRNGGSGRCDHCPVPRTAPGY